MRLLDRVTDRQARLHGGWLDGVEPYAVIVKHTGSVQPDLSINVSHCCVAGKDDFSRVPEFLLRRLGTPVHVMDLELNPERKLAQEDVVKVIKHLQEKGWHLQMPRVEDELEVH